MSGGPARVWIPAKALLSGRSKHTIEDLVIGTPPPSPPPGRPDPDSFLSFGLCQDILRAISEIGFRKPRPIQSASIPQALEGRDVLGLAQTGTGKTAAFALPIIERLLADPGDKPRALVLVPTRELAQQIHAEIQALAQFTSVTVVTLYGGVAAAPQVRALGKLPDIIVACPGRLLDLVGTGDLLLDGIEAVVLDEADHMLDMGFLPDITRILELLPKQRQNLLFSATMPEEIRVLADKLLRDPHVAEESHARPLKTIEHALYPVHQRDKPDLLRQLLKARGFRSAIVFLRTKQRAKLLAEDLGRAGYRAVALQGSMSQAQRRRAMQGFRKGHFNVLVATDIAARGLDVEGVSHVINYDIPTTPDAYTHRIGRTGRAERSGKAYTFVAHEDFPAILAIERALGMHIPRIKLRDYHRAGGARGSPGKPSRGAAGSGRAGRPGRRGQRGGPGNKRGARRSGGAGRNGGSGGRGRGGTGRR